MKRRAVVESVAILFVTLFLYTGISKLMDYSVFKEQIATSPFLAPMAQNIARLIPWIEFLVVMLLIIPRWRVKGMYASFILMVLFTSYIIAILIFNKRVPCSCGGVLEQLSWKQHIIFNGIFMMMALLGIAVQRRLTRENKQTQI